MSDLARRCPRRLDGAEGGGGGMGIPNTPEVPGVVVIDRNGGLFVCSNLREWGGGSPLDAPSWSGCEGSATWAKSELDRMCFRFICGADMIISSWGGFTSYTNAGGLEVVRGDTGGKLLGRSGDCSVRRMGMGD